MKKIECWQVISVEQVVDEAEKLKEAELAKLEEKIEK